VTPLSNPRPPLQRAKRAVAKRGRPVGGAKAIEMREQLLDRAEALFSRHGFHGVTIREVARSAKVDPALVHYYFETKQGLFDAVFVRRADVVNGERIRSLDAYALAAGGGMTVEGCIEAFLEPIVRRALEGDPGWKDYFRLVALVNSSAQWGGQMMARSFDPVIRRLLELLRTCLPDAKEENLFWAYHFLSGALTLSLSETGRIDRLSAGLCSSSDAQAIYGRMVAFTAAGFRRICQPQGQAAESRPQSDASIPGR
jgi:AcrR family transcriptional regulator